MDAEADVVVIGGGQAGLATSYWLRRAGIGHVVLDDADGPGGAWARMWPSLHAFSPPQHSSLPGWLMPRWTGEGAFPSRQHVADYLTAYEERYEVPVQRPVRVDAVRREGERLVVEGRPEGERSAWWGRAVVSATGTWSRPFWPSVPGLREFAGAQLHSAQYRGPESVPGGRVLVVGGGNTGAQLAAELAASREVVWATQRPPRFMPPEVDGRVLFDVATARRAALDAGRPDDGGVGTLGDIVQVPEVRAALAEGRLGAVPMVARLTASGVVWGEEAAEAAGSTWNSPPVAPGEELPVDAVLWCTGYRPALAHLRPLGVRGERGHVAVAPGSMTRAAGEPRLHLMGYGDWTGPASATLIGVGRPARAAAREIEEVLR
ncbi:ArsO family NAD(P)H-dependent flavin-containing monooxygenase [Kytococcus sp. HMSC28H12]|uniref:ArsO family NAD(P)H-dependent flavin-containing monooxygenase n=1 Tax=Kytococcus TaxID=57499 RepID=UPI0008A1F2C2|nr:ArsO family NAD(P)H-dependent flavin-containing monooxygenase [Kytococcus sp. HMSC28H12]OFS10478.1 pyridine nucleotide-disulfide oxidoreductase [Kytococcus sp. HMSC28H12]